MRIAIVDDEDAQSRLNAQYAERWAAQNHVEVTIDRFSGAQAFFFAHDSDQPYDVVLLDIQMPGQNGFELAQEIRKHDEALAIIFITGLTEYIGAGYDVRADNYLIKPVKEDRLHACLTRVKGRMSERVISLVVSVDGEKRALDQRDILYIEVYGHAVHIQTRHDRIELKGSLSDIDETLDERLFCRCHRAYIVGVKHIKALGKDSLTLENGRVIPISRRQYDAVNKAFIRYFRGDR